MNPPFSDQLPWLRRAHREWSLGNVGTVLCLAPARPDNRFFHETLRHVADFYILKGRLRFANPEGVVRSTPFALWVVMLGATPEQKARFAKLVPGCWMRPSDVAPE